jgi:transposase
MVKPLSSDLRLRVVNAVDGGMSRRAAADRFGVAISAVIKWHQRWRRTGSVEPSPQGGDRRSGRVEALGEVILGLVADTPDITLEEIAARLERDHAERFAPSVVHRFFARRGITFKKNRARSRTAKAGRAAAAAGLVREPA